MKHVVILGCSYIAIEASEFSISCQTTTNFTKSNATVSTVVRNIYLLSTCQKRCIVKLIMLQKVFIGYLLHLG